MTFALVDINGASVVSGTLQDLAHWIGHTEEGWVIDRELDKSWVGRDDVVVLVCLLGEDELYHLEPELTRLFLSQLTTVRN